MRILVGLLIVLSCVALSAEEAADEEGYVSLFNGKDLTGWVGDTEGYGVEDGLLVCKPGKNLFTEKQYADFSFKCEFKLTPAANNGIGIRVPMGGSASFAGMEIQILDDRHEKYEKIEPWQAHGSLYAYAAPKRDTLKPVGKWNSMQIIAAGRRVKVISNGVTILDADLDEAAAQGSLDGKERPGINNEKGHIVLLGHGDVVKFRNLSVKQLGK